MLRVHAQIGANNLYLSGEALDYDDKFWQPRIINEFEINREFEFSSKNNNKITSLSLSLDNSDGYFDTYEITLGLLNQKFTFYFNEGDDKVKSFTGKVNKVSAYGEKISLEVLQTGYEYLDMPMPDAQIAYDFYSTNGLNHSWNAIPIPIGTVNRLPLAWVNLAYSEFIIGSGPIFKVRKLYFDKVEVYNVDSGVNGYQPSPDYAKVKFRIFHGTGSDGFPETIDGHVSRYPGFAYIEVYKEDGGDPADPLTPDGETAQIYADIDGLRNAGNTDAERNPAQILYNLYTKNRTKWEGYGLGITPNPTEIDFDDAIDECNAQGFKIDGVLDKTTEFREWQKEICKCCRGAVVEEDGKIKMYIDTVKIPATTLFDESGDSGYVCDVSTWSEPDLESQINRMKLSYSWNFELQNYNKKPAINGESSIPDSHLINETHALRIGKWNTEELNFKLIKDDATAHKLAQYYLNKQVLQLKTATLTTIEDIPNLDAKDTISVTCSRYGWTAKEFIITKISRAQGKTTMSIREYDSDVYTFVNPGTGVEEAGNTHSVYNIPEKPVMNSLNLVNETLADGTNQTKISVNFTRPATNVVMTALYYKLSSEAESEFRALDVTVDTSQIQTIWKGIESGSYNFRLVSISPVGIYSSISIGIGDNHYYGQPGSETALAVVGDEGIPGQPNISSPVPTKGGASIYIEIAGGLPEDFSHFKIFRQFSGYPKAEIADNQTTQLFVDNDNLNQYLARQYSAIAYDKSGNASPESDLSISITPLQIGNNDITDGEQIIAKDFRTALDVQIGTPGIAFNQFGLNAYSNTANTFSIDANTGNVIMTGTITATAGVIGGFCIDPTEGIYSGTGSTRVQMKAGAGFWSGATLQADAPFSVNQSGYLKAESGNIAGWNFNYQCLYNNGITINSNGSIYGNYTTGSSGWCINGSGNAEFNNVTVRGTVCASTGCIATWSILTNSIQKYNSSTGYQIGMGAWNNNTVFGPHFYSGYNNGNSLITIGCYLYDRTTGTWSTDSGIAINGGDKQLFRVSTNSSGVFNCAMIAGWNFNYQCLYASNIIINSNGSIATTDFTTGNKGWCINSIGNAEFNNITARGAIKTAVFIKDEISVIGGKALIRPASVLTSDTTLTSTTNTFFVDDEQFAINDIIRIKDGTLNYWGTVSSVGFGYIIANYNNGTSSGIVTKGQAVVNYGVTTGCGGILLDGQTPYIDVYTHNGTPWNGTDSRVRLGNLNGSFGFTSNTYGIGIGCTTGHHMTYDTVSNTLNMTGAINIQSGSSGIQNISGNETAIDFNNYSITHSLNGYTGCDYLTFDLITTTKNGVSVCVNRLVSNCNSYVNSKTFKIDPTQAYKFTLSVCGDSTVGAAYFGLYVYDSAGNNIGVYPLSPSTGACSGISTNFYWWYGDATTWKDMEGYLLPENILPQDVPRGKNITQHAKMPSNAYCMRIRYLNYYNSGTTSTKLFYSPSVSKVNIENSNAVSRGLNSSGNLITSVIPSCSVAPSGSGLYLGSNYLGYYDGSNWKSYMDNCGHFYLSGINGGLGWDGSNLTVCGTVCASAGCIGDFDICNGCLCYYGSNYNTGLYLSLDTGGCEIEFNLNGMQYCRVYTPSVGYTTTIINFNSGVAHSISCKLDGYGHICNKSYYATPQEFTISATCDSSYWCSKLAFYSGNNGSTLGESPFKICVYGGNTRFAMCTNGVICASCFSGTATTATYTDCFRSVDVDRGLTTKYPNHTARSLKAYFVNASASGTGGNYAGVLHYSPYDGNTSSTGDASYQMAWGSTDINGGGVPHLRIRKGIDTTWRAWYDIFTAGRPIVTTPSDTPQIKLQNLSYGESLYLGGWSGASSCSRLTVSNGNIHMDSKTGSNIYFNHYSTGQIHMSGGGALLVAGCIESSSRIHGLYLGVNNTTNTNGYGISLYGGGVAGMPTYGIAFQGTATFGTHCGVTESWATYFTTSATACRGWIFRAGSTPVASINQDGSFGGYKICFRNNAYIASLNSSWLHYKGAVLGHYFYGNICVQTCICTPVVYATTCICSPMICSTGKILSKNSLTTLFDWDSSRTGLGATNAGLCIWTNNNTYHAICANGVIQAGTFCATCCIHITGSGNSSLIFNGACTGYGACNYGALRVCACVSTNTAVDIIGHLYATGLHQTSDCNLKTDFCDENVLEKLRTVNICSWRFKNDTTRHIGMTSQDFYNTFIGYAKNCTTVPMMDGIALKGVKEVDENVQLLEQCIGGLENCIDILSTTIKIQGQQIQQIQQQIGV